MLTAVKNVLAPVLVTAFAIFAAHCSVGCIPPFGQMDELESAYKSDVSKCGSTGSLQAQCNCMVAVDERWGLCDKPEWPQFGRCDYACEVRK